MTTRAGNTNPRRSNKLRTGSIVFLGLAFASFLLCGGQPAAADDYVVEIGGTPGTHFAGTCLLFKGRDHTSHAAVGKVPLKLEFSGDLISCAVQRKDADGAIHLSIVTQDGRTVAISAATQPFGVVTAAGH